VEKSKESEVRRRLRNSAKVDWTNEDKRLRFDENRNILRKVTHFSAKDERQQSDSQNVSINHFHLHSTQHNTLS